MKTPSLFLGVALLLMASWASAGKQASGDRAIKDVATAIDKAVARGDADGYVADAADDAIVMPPDGPAIVGRDAIRAWVSGVFDGVTVEMKHIPEDITVAGGLAYMHGRSVGTFTPKAGGASVSFDNKYVWILRKGAQGRWQIVRVMWNSNAPPK
jgi:uncharacterized protein (TIGR02246 family)